LGYIKKINTLINSKNLIYSFRDTVCWVNSETSIKCTNAQSINSEFSVSGLSLGSLSSSISLKLVDPLVVGNESALGVGFRDLYGNIYYGSFNTNQVFAFSFSSQVAQFQSLSSFKTDDFNITYDISVVGKVLFKSFTQNALVIGEFCNNDGDCAAGTCVGPPGSGYCHSYEDQTRSEHLLLGIPTRVLSPYFAFLGESASNFSWGRDVFQNTWSCVLDIKDSSFASCSFNDQSNNFAPSVAVSFTTLQSISQLLYPPSLDRTSGLYITQEMQGPDLVNGVVKFLGVPYCYQGSSTGSCSYASYPYVESISGGLNGATQVSLGAWGACAVAGDSLTCWGANMHLSASANVLWNGYRSVTGVSVYDSGACVQFISNEKPVANCWGPLSVIGNVSFSNQILYSLTVQPKYSCDSEENLVYDNLCYPCHYGQILETLNGQGGSFPCLDCVSLSGGLPSARGPNDMVCVPCDLGSRTSANGEMCIACPLNSIRTTLSDSTPMPQCQECTPGFQASANFQTCVQCPAGTARYATSLSCHTCPLGSTPSADQSMCISCPQPQILVGTLPNIICLACPLGQHALEGICALCPTPLFRSDTMFDCSPCPEGTQPSADFTYCISCPPNTVRKDTSKCYSCPTGTHPSENKTVCVRNTNQLLKFFLSPGKTAAISTGLLVLSACAILSSLKKLTMGQSALGYAMGLLIMSGAFLI
jgi:hypothetical protein